MEPLADNATVLMSCLGGQSVPFVYSFRGTGQNMNDPRGILKKSAKSQRERDQKTWHPRRKIRRWRGLNIQRIYLVKIISKIIYIHFKRIFYRVGLCKSCVVLSKWFLRIFACKWGGTQVRAGHFRHHCIAQPPRLTMTIYEPHTEGGRIDLVERNHLIQSCPRMNMFLKIQSNERCDPPRIQAFHILPYRYARCPVGTLLFDLMWCDSIPDTNAFIHDLSCPLERN